MYLIPFLICFMELQLQANLIEQNELQQLKSEILFLNSKNEHKYDKFIFSKLVYRRLIT